MKFRWIFPYFLTLLAMLTLPNIANTAPQQGQKSTALLVMTGTVSQNGALFVCTADKKMYPILNSETLKHLNGQVVALKARLIPEKQQLYVTLVRAISNPAPVELAKLDDAAFRR